MATPIKYGYACYARLNVHVLISNYALIRICRSCIDPLLRNAWDVASARKRYYRDIASARKRYYRDMIRHH